MKIAVEGCAHGELDNIYAALQHLELVEDVKIDLLICCGDFQAVRNEEDLQCLACPQKYRSMKTFWKYYSGVEVAPYPTIFIGGNHEASNYLWELFYGGWAAPQIYFLGFAGVVRFGSLRIGGLSGIFKPYDYKTGHYEHFPYSDSDLRSIYHIREYDVSKLLQIEEPLDIFVSHDWPHGIAKYGDISGLLHDKPFLRNEIREGTLGSKPGELLLRKLKPSYWFAAHLHTKFAAFVQHAGEKTTKFLALDKCLPHRDFLQLIEIPSTDSTPEFSYDEEWLAITRANNPYLPLCRGIPQLPRSKDLDLAGHLKWVKKRLMETGATIPCNFQMTVPPYSPTGVNGVRASLKLSDHMRNPSTEALCQLLEMPFLLDRFSSGNLVQRNECKDPNEITIMESDTLSDDIDELEGGDHTLE